MGTFTMDRGTVSNYTNTIHSTIGMIPNEAIETDDPEEVIKNTRKSNRFNSDVMDDEEIPFYFLAFAIFYLIFEWSVGVFLSALCSRRYNVGDCEEFRVPGICKKCKVSRRK